MPVVRFNGKKLDPATIKALVAGTLVNGSKPSVWWNRQSIDFRNSFMDTIRTSMRNGESLTQAAARINGGIVDGVSVPGIMKTTKSRATALAATSMSAVTNEAALQTFQANNDVIKAVTQVSTLDNKTSDICVAYSGQTWDVNTLQPVMGGSLPFNGGPPRHFNCRSRLRPVTMSFKELGIDKAEIPAGTRASMDGQVPADITFNQFLKKKGVAFQDELLGPARAQLYRNGDITLTQLVDMRGNPMTIAQLEARLGIKPKAIPKKAPKPSKKMVDSFLENDDGTFVKISQAEYSEIRGHARRLTAAADDADALVTQQIKGMADDVGAKFPDAAIVKDGPLVDEGSLHWRKKDLDSTSRKIQTYARDRNITYTEAADQISDSLRYTYIMDEDDYVKGIQEVMERFAQLGYKNNKFDPAWLLRPDYKGLNINMVSPTGVRMELQFHTAKSFHVKDQLNHVLYEKFRKLSKAKQVGPEGQALQAEMLANAQAIPVPKNIKFLEDLAKIYNKPNVAQQEKIFAQAKTRQLAAEKVAAESKAAQKFNNAVANFIVQNNDQKVLLEWIAKQDSISDAVKASAAKRVDDAFAQATKKANKLIDDLDKKYPTGLKDFENAVDDAIVAVESTDTMLAGKMRERAFKIMDEPARQDVALIAKLETRIEHGVPESAMRTIINNSKATPAAKTKANELVSKAIKAGKKEADEAFALIEDIEFTSQSEYASWVKSIRPGLKSKYADKEFMELVHVGENKVIGNVALREAVKQVELGDYNAAKQALIHLDVEQLNPEIIAKLSAIDKGMIDIAAKAVKGLDDLMDIVQPTSVQHIEDAVTAAANLAKPTMKIQMQNYGNALVQQFEAKQAKIISEFPFKVIDDLKKSGFSHKEIALIDSQFIDDLAILKNGIYDDAVRTGMKKRIVEAKDQIDTAVARIKALNKKSSGVDFMTAHINTLPDHIRTSTLLQDAIKLPMKQAVSKAKKARFTVKKELVHEGLDFDELDTYAAIIDDALSTVHKKLGPQQLKAKVNEIKAKIASQQADELSIAQYAADPTNYDKLVVDLLSTDRMKQLEDTVKMFLKEGAGSSEAKKNMGHILYGKTAKQERAIMEYVHRRVNPKKLANGMDFDAKVADIVTKHANNAGQTDINKLMDKFLSASNKSERLNFERTVMTRTGIKDLDELGVLAEGDAPSSVLKIRSKLAKDDPGSVPIPTHTADEQLKAAKKWLNSDRLDDVEFKRQQLQSSKSFVSSGKGKIQEGDRIFGENSWGITPQEWQKWVDDVAPTLTEWDVALINQYTGGMAGRINAGLYDGGLIEEWTAGARALNSALDKMPKHKGTVYRSTSQRENWSADYIDARYEIGKTVTERGFGSSSTQTSSQFNGNLKFIIKTNGNSGAIIGHIGQYGTSEMEVLFKAGTKFKVIKKKRSGGGITVWMEEI